VLTKKNEKKKKRLASLSYKYAFQLVANPHDNEIATMRQKMNFQSFFAHNSSFGVTESTTLRSQMRRAQRRRLLSIRPLLLCVLSVCTILVVIYIYSQQSQTTNVATAALWQHNHPYNPKLREKGLMLSSSAAQEHLGTVLHQTDTTAFQAQFAIPPLHQFAPRRSEDEEDQDSEQYHNPSLYGWTPDVYPDPLANPIRCAIAYLPETNMTDGLRYVHYLSLYVVQIFVLRTYSDIVLM